LRVLCRTARLASTRRLRSTTSASCAAAARPPPRRRPARPAGTARLEPFPSPCPLTAPFAPKALTPRVGPKRAPVAPWAPTRTLPARLRARTVPSAKTRPTRAPASATFARRVSGASSLCVSRVSCVFLRASDSGTKEPVSGYQHLASSSSASQGRTPGAGRSFARLAPPATTRRWRSSKLAWRAPAAPWRKREAKCGAKRAPRERRSPGRAKPRARIAPQAPSTPTSVRQALRPSSKPPERARSGVGRLRAHLARARTLAANPDTTLIAAPTDQPTRHLRPKRVSLASLSVFVCDAWPSLPVCRRCVVRGVRRRSLRAQRDHDVLPRLRQGRLHFVRRPGGVRPLPRRLLHRLRRLCGVLRLPRSGLSTFFFFRTFCFFKKGKKWCPSKTNPWVPPVIYI
jgi:hypothetical protein